SQINRPPKSFNCFVALAGQQQCSAIQVDEIRISGVESFADLPLAELLWHFLIEPFRWGLIDSAARIFEDQQARLCGWCCGRLGRRWFRWLTQTKGQGTLEARAGEESAGGGHHQQQKDKDP